MKLSEKIRELAKTAGAEEEVMAVEDMMEKLSGGGNKNVAVLGEMNCGKTSLINRLAGTEVRKPTRFASDARPLMVTFDSGPGKPGYEVIEAASPKCKEMKVNFFEIPLNMAVDPDTGKASAMLEEMDAVIYITSAIMPFTASDAANLDVIMDLFPMILYVSRADVIDNDEDYKAAMEYIREEAAARFQGEELEILDSRRPDAADIILKGIQELPLEEMREFHLARLEQRAREAIAEKLRCRLRQMDEEEREREKEKAAGDAARRERQLEWEELRLGMLERKQASLDLINQRMEPAKELAKKKLEKQLAETSHKKEWVEQELENALRAELESSVQAIIEELKERAWTDAVWLAAEAEKKCGIKIDVEYMEGKQQVPPGEKEEPQIETPGCHRLVAAAGSGILAAGAVFSSLTLLPTCLIAIPASVAMVCFLKGNVDDQEQYHQKLRGLAAGYCDKSYAAAAKPMRDTVNEYYEAVAKQIQSLDSREGTKEDVGEDINAHRKELMGMLAELEEEI